MLKYMWMHTHIYRKQSSDCSQGENSDNTWQNSVTSSNACSYLWVFWSWQGDGLWTTDFKWLILLFPRGTRALGPVLCILEVCCSTRSYRLLQGWICAVFSSSSSKAETGMKLLKRHWKTLKVDQDSYMKSRIPFSEWILITVISETEPTEVSWVSSVFLHGIFLIILNIFELWEMVPLISFM